MSSTSADQLYAKTVAGHVRSGRGGGIGVRYKPWRTVRTKGQHANSWRTYSKNGRTYHLLNNLMMSVFVLLNRSPHIIDIREQFPLLPLSKTRQIADEIQVSHPRGCPFRNKDMGKVEIVMTTDFVLDLVDDEQLPATVAISVKRASQLAHPKSPQLVRLLNIAEIERRYWEARKVPFLLITEADIPTTLLDNVAFLHRFEHLDGVDLPTSFDDLADHLFDRVTAAADLPAKTHGANFDSAMGLSPGTGITLIWHALSRGRWPADLMRPLGAHLPLPLRAEASPSGEVRP